jgi:hypothetical protein
MAFRSATAVLLRQLQGMELSMASVVFDSLVIHLYVGALSYSKGERMTSHEERPRFRCSDGRSNSVLPLLLSDQLNEIHINRAEPESNFAIGEVVVPHPSEALVET